MKTVITVAALSLISAAAFAKSAPTVSPLDPLAVMHYQFQGDTEVPVLDAPLTRSRADVQAELKASQSRKDYVFAGDTWVPRSVFMSERSRDEVRAEAARQNRMASLGESRH